MKLRWEKCVPILLMAAGILAYHNSFRGPFIFDDVNAIVENLHVRHVWPLREAMSAPAQATVDGRPVVSLSLALNYAVSGLNAWSYHALNLLVHMLSTLLLYGIARRTLAGPRLRERFGTVATGLATTIALLWTVHPLLTESVDYVVQRTELLMSVFLLATLYCVIRAHELRRKTSWFLAAVISCALGMASKEVMVVAPLLVVVYVRLFLSHSWRETVRQQDWMLAGLAATWLVLAACIAHGPRTETVGVGFTSVAPVDYAWTQCGVILHYLRLTVWPVPLVLDYDDWPIAKSFVAVWPAAVTVMSLVAATAWLLWRGKPAGFLGAWFFLILAPTSSVVPIVTEVVAERRMYLPAAAVVTLAVIGVWMVIEKLRWPEMWGRVAQRGLAGAFAVILCIATVRRTNDYQSDESIWRDTVAKRPKSARAHLNLGSALVGHGKLDEAVAQFHQALKLKPGYVDAHYNLGIALAVQGKEDEARRQFSMALQGDPNNAKAHCNLGILLAHQGSVEQATKHLTEAVRLNPDYAEAHNSLGGLLAMQHKLGEAFAHFVAAVKLSPDMADAHYNLGVAQAQQGRRGAAVQQLEAALRLDPANQRTRDILAQVRGRAASAE